jgi:selenocysteine lyase/cysteine desulfurase
VATAVPDPLSIAEAQALFARGVAWLDTAGHGLPPLPAWDALQDAMAAWRHGRPAFGGWEASVAAARARWARLHGVAPADVAVGAQVSAFAGLVAAALPAGARVLAAEEDFTSLLFPLLAQEARGVRVRLVPLEALPQAIDGGTDLVAVSAVQSADGRLADLAAVAEAAAHHGPRTLIDATQASGWLPLAAGAFDYVACAAHKWLLAPRGAAFLYVAPARRDELVAGLSGWYAGEGPPAALYGGPLRLAGDARRFDLSPAWPSWVALAPALDVLERVGIEAVHAHDVALARAFRAGLGLPPGDSAIVSVDAAPGALERLRRAGVAASGRDGRLRFSFHLSTRAEDVERALAVLA